ncbi:hypothetical protein Hsw_0071 [Hymenobacter swuensis DY53]|uniref:Uncharacterized protein n=1 Tax=Hymenobacter swuensis DY53 TaxID=1227739 RepID=W8EZ83_9BACT|nr:hypothetical protein Hsw_0071 [Hymenobacter swuensis DY53]
MKPVFASPCLACRRRFRWNGQPLFATCTCLNYGSGVTAVALVAGVVLVAGILWSWRRC